MGVQGKEEKQKKYSRRFAFQACAENTKNCQKTCPLAAAHMIYMHIQERGPCSPTLSML